MSDALYDFLFKLHNDLANKNTKDIPFFNDALEKSNTSLNKQIYDTLKNKIQPKLLAGTFGSADFWCDLELILCELATKKFKGKERNLFDKASDTLMRIHIAFSKATSDIQHEIEQNDFFNRNGNEKYPEFVTSLADIFQKQYNDNASAPNEFKLHNILVKITRLLKNNGITLHSEDKVATFVSHMVRLIDDVVKHVFEKTDLYKSIEQDFEFVEAEYKKWMPSNNWIKLGQLLQDIKVEKYNKQNFDRDTWKNFLFVIFDNWIYLKSNEDLKDIIDRRFNYKNICVKTFYDYIHYYSLPATINDTVISNFSHNLSVCDENFKTVYIPEPPVGVPIPDPTVDPPIVVFAADAAIDTPIDAPIDTPRGGSNLFIWIAAVVAVAVVATAVLWFVYSGWSAGRTVDPDIELEKILG